MNIERRRRLSRIVREVLRESIERDDTIERLVVSLWQSYFDSLDETYAEWGSNLGDPDLEEDNKNEVAWNALGTLDLPDDADLLEQMSSAISSVMDKIRSVRERTDPNLQRPAQQYLDKWTKELRAPWEKFDVAQSKR
jgi:hypothetical protein